VLAANFCKKFLLPVGCQLFSVNHLVGRLPDANFGQSAASQMQFASG
jgi:hypothetical protein